MRMKDKELIEKLGGAKVLGEHLGLKYPHQTIGNWKKRGIPSHMKVQYPELFQTENPPNLREKVVKNDQT